MNEEFIDKIKVTEEWKDLSKNEKEQLVNEFFKKSGKSLTLSSDDSRFKTDYDYNKESLLY